MTGIWLVLSARPVLGHKFWMAGQLFSKHIIRCSSFIKSEYNKHILRSEKPPTDNTQTFNFPQFVSGGHLNFKIPCAGSFYSLTEIVVYYYSVRTAGMSICTPHGQQVLKHALTSLFGASEYALTFRNSHQQPNLTTILD
jgi:hypothetical protein